MRFLSAFFSIIILCIIVCGGGFFYLRNQYHTPNFQNKSDYIMVERGDSMRTTLDMLVEKQWLDKNFAFALPYILKYSPEPIVLKAGEYEIPAYSTPKNIIDILQSGKTITHKITIPEGTATAMALDILTLNNVLTGDITLKPLEGELDPNTYVFSRGTHRDDIIKQMMSAAQKNLDKAWDMRPDNFILKNKQELLILASIVEKETGIASERPLVASVFLNRLQKNMRLQSDPTIIYGITQGKIMLNRPIYRSDIIRTTPYNTYTIDGLPPQPICNPGIDALMAVVKPAKTDYIFFVADGTGGHAFAATLSKHNDNVLKWRAIEKSL